MCPADRLSSPLTCAANDVDISRLEVLNGVTTCVAGQPVTLDLRVFLSLNARDRHDLGVFIAKDGKNPGVPSADGGSADCAVVGFPQSPFPFADLDGNACGDFDRTGLPQGTQVALDVGSGTYTCVADETGRLLVPAVVTWQQSSTVCNSPAAAWIEPGTASKCGAIGRTDVLVQGRIVINKFTFPSGDATTFALTASGPEASPTAFNLSDGQSQTILTAPLSSTPQTYVIHEPAVAGWAPTAVVHCTDALGNPASFATINHDIRSIIADMSVTNPELFCTVVNQKIGTGTITTNKVTIGGDGTFEFTGAATFFVTTTAGSGSFPSPDLAPGAYSVVESVATGWTLTGINCVGTAAPPVTSVPSRSATVTLAAGENAVCTWTNTKTGSITINEVAVGGDAHFDYTTTGTDLSDFTILTVGGTGTQAFTGTNGLLPGAYSVTGVTPAGWTLTDVSCTGTATPATIGGGSASITLGAGESAVCTFTHTKDASLVINKQAVGADGTFPYTSTVGPFSIATSSRVGHQIFAGLTAGSYTVTEGTVAGWHLIDLVCGGTASAATTSVADRTAAVTIAPGEEAFCTFTNARGGSITIRKAAAGGDDSFGYTATGIGVSSFEIGTAGGAGASTFAGTNGLPAGAYSVTELATSGWTLEGVACNGTAIPATIAGATATITLGAGENAECTYSNSKQAPPGSITVNKLVVGGDATFSYTATGQSPFTVTTAGGLGQHILTGLPAGTYTVTEFLPTGWDVTDVTCGGAATPVVTSVPDHHAIVTLAAGESVVCTFTNTSTGSITIDKVAVGGDAGFGYTVTGSGLSDFTIATSDGVGSHVLTLPDGLLPGSYSVTELATSGWKLSDIHCTGTAIPPSTAGGTVTLTLGTGEHARCTYINVKQVATAASLTIDKSAMGGDGSFDYTTAGSGLLPFTLDTTTGATTRTFAGLSPGSYSVTESVPPGWTLAGVDCRGMATPPIIAGGTATLTLAAGETAHCTYTDVKQVPASGSITVNKVTKNDDGVFHFMGTGVSPFTIVTASNVGQHTLSGLAAGTYTVTEGVVAGWDVIDVSCGGTTAPPSTSVVDHSATVTLAAGENAVCTFTDVRSGSITIKKTAAGGDATFRYTATGSGLSEFTITTAGGTGSRVFTDTHGLPAGSYTVTELPTDGWAQTGVSCTGTAIPVSISGATVNITLGDGENAVCTYTNSKQPPPGSITVNKVTVGGNATFSYTATGLSPFTIITSGSLGQRLLAGLGAGTYTVTESVPAGWDVTDVSCSGAATPPATSVPDHHAIITLAAGESVVCTFTNTKTGSITIDKVAVGGDASFGYTTTGNDLSNFTILTVGGTGTQVFTGTHGLLPGSYSVTELATSGWKLSDIHCTGTAIPPSTAGGTVILTLGTGEHARCTYTNVKQSATAASLTIDKSAVGGDGSFGYTTTGTGLSPFTLVTTAGAATRTFAGLVPGSYSVTESVPTGWELTSIDCGGTATPPILAGRTATLTLAAGETAHCTYTDVKQVPPIGSIIVNKVTKNDDGVFQFTGTGISPFTIVTASSVGQHTISGLAPGSYTVTEVPQGEAWLLIGLTCADESGGTTANLATATASIDLAPGETVICTFTNRLATSIPTLSDSVFTALGVLLLGTGWWWLRRRQPSR